jgi:hypothetical protein
LAPFIAPITACTCARPAVAAITPAFDASEDIFSLPANSANNPQRRPLTAHNPTDIAGRN